jgi:hypothetical protein
MELSSVVDRPDWLVTQQRLIALADQTLQEAVSAESGLVQPHRIKRA